MVLVITLIIFPLLYAKQCSKYLKTLSYLAIIKTYILYMLYYYYIILVLLIRKLRYKEVK